MNRSAHLNRILLTHAGMLIAGCLSQSVFSAPLSLADTPLFLGTPIAPNLVITLDDSLSMPAASVPDSINNDDATKRFKSSYYNALYYNPTVQYTPPPKYNGQTCTLDATNPATCYPNVSFTAVPINGFATTKGTTTSLSTSNACDPAGTSSLHYSPVNLSNNYAATGDYNPSADTQTCATGNGVGTNHSATCTVTFAQVTGNDRITVSGTGCSSIFTSSNMPSGTVVTISGASTSSNNQAYTASYESSTAIRVSPSVSNSNNNANVSLSWSVVDRYPAYYYLFYTAAGVTKPSACTATVANQKSDDNCYIQVEVGTASDIYKNPDGSAASTAQKQQNFANWYSYYRTRNLALASGAMRAFAGLSGNVRVAWQALNNSGITCNTFGTTCRGWDSSQTDNRIRRLDSTLSSAPTNGRTHKQELYDWLARFPVAGSTYLRNAAINAGNYFTGTININHPYADDPQIRDKPLNPDGTSRTTYDACRRNVHLIMTDGGWCGDSSMFTAVSDLNSSANTLPVAKPTSSDGASTSTSWTPGPPYRDYQSNNLSDIAFKYWVTDLQTGTGMPNNLSPSIRAPNSGDLSAQWLDPRNDPATWQHMVTYTVGLGLGSTMDGTPDSGGTGSMPVWQGSTFTGSNGPPKTGYNALSDTAASCPNPPTSSSAASASCWPYTNTGDSCPPSALDQQRKVYDLWHAAISGRGEFYSADSAQSIVDALKNIVEQVKVAEASSASLAANSTSIQTGTQLFQARFDSSDWHGEIIAYPVQSNGTIGTPYWNSGSLLTGSTSTASNRKIFTWNSSTGGQSFSSCSSNLSTSQQTALNTNSTGTQDSPSQCNARLAWLRGDPSNEQRNGGSYRNRAVSVLGDVINSDPIFVLADDYGYGGASSAVDGKADYAAFVAGKSSRTPAIYVGADDGMLHAFRADTGDTNSGKELFAFIPDGVYSKLSNLTYPTYIHKYYVDGPPNAGDAYLSGAWKTVLVGGLGAGGKSIYALDISSPSTFSSGNVLWEYSDASDLGNTYSQPQIARLNNGDWAAIIGNGYNSASDKAFLYVVRLSDGQLIKKIAAGTSTSNGLSTPVLYDSNSDKIIDYVYAGDLQGHLWKFDLSASSASSWAVGNGGSPLFTATNASNQVQPITAQPTLGAHASGGLLVYFGTGQYLTSADISNLQVQSFYAIWDKVGVTGTVSRSDLQAQTITAETTEFGYKQRQTSNDPVDWGTKRGWYMDLVPPSGAAGERIISAALQKYDRAVFVTLIPSGDPCVGGGDSWLMELDNQTGGRTGSSAFDFNKDNQYDNNDKLSSGNFSSGVQSTVGITKTPTWLKGTGQDFKELSGSTGGIMSLGNRAPQPVGTPALPSRKYWMQIM